MTKYIPVKSLFLSLALAISTGQLLGQPSTQKFSLGVKAGPLMTWSVFGDSYEGRNTDNKLKLGYYGAGIISFPLKNNYSCVIEGGFSQKGRKVIFEDKKNDATYYFVDAALLLRKSFHIQLGKNIPATCFINVGPHVSYWLGGKGKIGYKDGDGTPYKVVFADTFILSQSKFKTMYLVEANRWLFGADIGIGMTAPIRSTQRVLTELRFTWGHTFYGGRSSARYNWVDFTDTNMRSNERVISFTVAYMFDFDLREAKKGRSTKDKEVKRKPVKRKRR